MRTLLRSASVAAVLLIAISSFASAQESARKNNRNGLFGGIGLGYGILGALDCPGSGCDTEGGFSGNGRIGGTLSPSTRIAVGSNGWVKTDQLDVVLGVYSGQVLYYPGEKDFFLLGGAGLALAICDGCDTETGAGFVVGGGYDIPINKSGSLALTPYLNWIVTTLEGNLYVLQFGLGLTFN